MRQVKKLMVELQDPAIRDNPYAFVKFCYPWGKKGSPLEHYEGPKEWQRDELLRIRDFVGEQKVRLKKGESYHVYQSATASGRGIGKSALVSWIQHWMITTRMGSSTIISANSEDQLKTRTWAEIGRWHALAVNGFCFEKTATRMVPHKFLASAIKEDLEIDPTHWYSNATLWNEENTAGFAGLHNQYGELVIFDEASGIPKSIWNVTAGIFTDPIPDRFWFVFSNPRENAGAFFDCFHADKAFWHTRNIDARFVEGTDRNYYDKIVRQHGEDSDFTRIEVKGQFPEQGDDQFISPSIVDDARLRDAETLIDTDAGLIMGVDPARFGEDSTAIRWRQGRVARFPHVPKPLTFKGKDNMQVADLCADLINKYNPDAVCIDAGNGTGIIDRLRQRGYRVYEVWFGASADDKEQFTDKRTELWAKMRDWLEGAAIDTSEDLRADLIAPKYEYPGGKDKLKLESKEKMRARDIESPDDADALAVTFFVNVPHRSLRMKRRAPRVATGADYDLFGG